MTGVLSTLIAVLGTLLGAVVTHLFQRTATKRSQDFTAQQQLRSERMAVYSDFAGAVTEFRRGQHDRWHRKNEDPDSTACFDARVEAYRLRGVALHALFRVQLIASSQALVDAAQHAYKLTSDAHRASSKTELSTLGEQARQALESFISMASSDVR
ncbi:hypothetical protein CUT44_19950 [Streptomyces carminius]|uniref:Uncharacterized protein n=1 Tax=Streptomyces carminius TaxID=2665496 RepID=A0A2M8LVT0_9ACTN|nr:hypothetical protein [Streptomyces carminius]PJE96067.1 hypothetical protein CUT44_19950 [Streptomyces carminius]